MRSITRKNKYQNAFPAVSTSQLNIINPMYFQDWHPSAASDAILLIDDNDFIWYMHLTSNRLRNPTLKLKKDLAVNAI